MLTVLKKILDELDAFVYVTDLATDEILFINKKIKENFHLEHDGSGKTCWQVMQRGQNKRCPFCPVFQLEKDPGTPVMWEELNSVTGRYYKKTDSIIEWSDGKKAHLQQAIDITEMKDMQREYARTQEVLQHILDGMDSFVYVSDVTTDEILFINQRMKDALNLGDDVVGKTCWKVLKREAEGKCASCPNEQLLEYPTLPIFWEERNPINDRYYRNVDSLIEWVDGKKAHMQHSTDITDIISAQEEAFETRERLEMALTASRAGVWELDFEQNLLTYDAMCGTLFGFDPTRRSMPLEELIAHLDKTVAASSDGDITEGLRKGDPYSDNDARDMHLVFPGGGERHLRNYGNTIRSEDGKAHLVVGMCIDITRHVTMENELTAAKEAAENASRAKSQFLSNMSHEIRTPMNAIIGMTDILMSEDLNNRQQKFLNDIKVASNSLLGIINDILDFSKIEAGKLRIVPVDYNPLLLLENLNSMFSASAKAKNIAFAMEIRSEIPSCLFGDDIRIRQVLINILGNAVKFTKEGCVTFAVYASGDTLHFEISDTGIGIKEEDMPSIFKDFNRMDLGNNRTIAGTGLGLSITKNLISLMDGSIRVESAYGKGTTFHVTLPLVIGNPTKQFRGTAIRELLEAPDANILVVDDNEVNLNVAAGMLGLSDILCDTALSGREAIDKIAAKRYDIVFMDHMMPEMDGVEATRLIRRKFGKDSPVIVALTANAIEGVKETLLAAGMDDYLSKPIDKAQLNNVLRKWLPRDKVRAKQRKRSSASKAAQPLSPLLAQIEEIEGVDIREGLGRIYGMQDIYEKSITILERRLPDAINRLGVFLRGGELPEFTIEVHGLKGSLDNIGAFPLARAAEELERHAKQNDLSFCRERLPALTNRLVDLHRKLADALKKQKTATQHAAKGDVSVLQKRLALVRALLESFEADEAIEILRDAGKYDYGYEANAVLKNIGQFIDEFDYDQAIALIDATWPGNRASGRW